MWEKSTYTHLSKALISLHTSSLIMISSVKVVWEGKLRNLGRYCNYLFVRHGVIFRICLKLSTLGKNFRQHFEIFLFFQENRLWNIVFHEKYLDFDAMLVYITGKMKKKKKKICFLLTLPGVVKVKSTKKLNTPFPPAHNTHKPTPRIDSGTGIVLFNLNLS